MIDLIKIEIKKKFKIMAYVIQFWLQLIVYIILYKTLQQFFLFIIMKKKRSFIISTQILKQKRLAILTKTMNLSEFEIKLTFFFIHSKLKLLKLVSVYWLYEFFFYIFITKTKTQFFLIQQKKTLKLVFFLCVFINNIYVASKAKI